MPLRHYHRKLDAGFVALPQMTGRRFGMPFILSPPTLTLRFRQNNGPTPSGDYQPSRSLSMAGSVCGLVDESGRGRHSLLTDHQKNAVVARVEKSPRSLKTVLSEIEAEFGVALSIDTLKLICKQAGLVWKRVRKSLRKKRNQEEFDRSKEKIEGFVQQHQEGEIDLCYFDESGFTLEPCVPYAWQQTGETIEIPSSKSKRLNVLGFVNRDCELTLLSLKAA